jgi:hypothetical protein
MEVASTARERRRERYWMAVIVGSLFWLRESPFH